MQHFMTNPQLAPAFSNQPLQARNRSTGLKINPHHLAVDEAYARLNSTLYGSLMHAANVTAACIGADIAASRVFNAPGHAVNVYVSTRGMEIDPNHMEDFWAWPNDPESIFSYVAKGDVQDRVFCTSEMNNVLHISQGRYFARLERHVSISDALCTTIALTEKAWVMLVFLRCKDHDPFDRSQINVLHHYKTVLAHLILRGYREESRSDSSFSTRNHDADRASNISVAELINKLSRTERQILDHLRSCKTEYEIAQLRDRSPNTIHTQVKSIYHKLDISSRRQLFDLFGSID